MRSLVTSIFLYACKSWILTAERSLCQDPVSNGTKRRPYHRKETQTAVVWSCLPFIMSGQNHLARHSERGKKTRQTNKKVGRQHQGMGRYGDYKVPEDNGEQKQNKTKNGGNVLSCFVLLKSVLLISCVFWIFFQNAGSQPRFRFFFFHKARTRWYRRPF